MFKRMLGAIGVGALSVDTVLDEEQAHPGGPASGRVELAGGNHDVEIQHITLNLVTRMEVEGAEEEYSSTAGFYEVAVSDALYLSAGENVSLPFRFTLPWETPITAVDGHTLPGMVMGVRTEVAIAGAVDKGDLDSIHVNPLPAQQRILDAFRRLGFTFAGADLEYGHVDGVPQTLPFHQEIEYAGAPGYGVGSAELTFVTTAHAVEVILEFDGGHETYAHHTVAHSAADSVDWTAQLDTWIREAPACALTSGPSCASPRRTRCITKAGYAPCR